MDGAEADYLEITVYVNAKHKQVGRRGDFLNCKEVFA